MYFLKFRLYYFQFLLHYFFIAIFLFFIYKIIELNQTIFFLNFIDLVNGIISKVTAFFYCFMIIQSTLLMHFKTLKYVIYLQIFLLNIFNDNKLTIRCFSNSFLNISLRVYFLFGYNLEI